MYDSKKFKNYFDYIDNAVSKFNVSDISDIKCDDYINLLDIRISNKVVTFFTSLNDKDNYIEYLLQLLFSGTMSMDYSNYVKTRFLCNLISISYGEDGYIITHDGKQKIKLGKFISKIISLIEQNGYSVKRTKNDIENIVDKYKSYNFLNNDLKFKILKGDDILKGYDINNFEYRNSSALHGSCMNGKFDNLELYTKNDDKISLLTLNRYDKIVGRTLIWKLDKPEYIYMDRVYTIDNYLQNIFNNFAKINKWVHRESYAANNFRVNCYLKSLDDYDMRYSSMIRMSIKLRINEINKYPFMDSFVYRSHLNNNFYVNSNNMINFSYYQSTSGEERKIKTIPFLSLFS